jgi:hypothetical protein
MANPTKKDASDLVNYLMKANNSRGVKTRKNIKKTSTEQNAAFQSLEIKHPIGLSKEIEFQA